MSGFGGMKMKALIKNWLIMFCGVLVLAACNPFKVTDPHDPHFDPMKFDFYDYRNHKEMAEVLRALFPVGTPLERVDEILVDVGGGSRIEWERTDIKTFGANVERKINTSLLVNRSKRIIRYGHFGKNPKFFANQKFSWLILFFFDENDRVIQAIAQNEVVFLTQEGAN